MPILEATQGGVCEYFKLFAEDRSGTDGASRYIACSSNSNGGWILD